MIDLNRLDTDINDLKSQLAHWQTEIEQARQEENKARAAYELARRERPEDQPPGGDEETTRIEWTRAKRRLNVLGRIIEEVEKELQSKETELQSVRSQGVVETTPSTKEDQEMGASVRLDQGEKLQLAMDRMWGAAAKESASEKDVPAFKGFRHAFKVITGRDIEDMLGHVISNAQEEILAANWVNVLGTSMYKRLLKDYAAPNFGEDTISRPRPGGLRDFNNVDALRVEYFADLAVVEPEALGYQEIAVPGDEIVQYHAIQYGNLVTISRKALLADDLGAATRVVGRLGRAARRTKAKFIWAFAMNNVNYDVDGLPWFGVAPNHGNLTATALTANLAGANAIITILIALANMTEPGSGESLGLPAFQDLRVYLAVPTALMGVARALNQAPEVLDAFNLLEANPVYHLFGANDERIVVCPFFTDATDWYVYRDPDEVDSIEIGYVLDQREPEFFVASVPTIGQMFTDDKQQFKVRHEYGGDILDYRGACKSVQ